MLETKVGRDGHPSISGEMIDSTEFMDQYDRGDYKST
jgi:hypothetical protein